MENNSSGDQLKQLLEQAEAPYFKDTLRLFSSPWCDRQRGTCCPKPTDQCRYAEDLLKTQKEHNSLPIPTTLQGTVRDPQSNEAPITHMNVKALPWLKRLHKGLSTVLPCTLRREDPVLLVPFSCLLPYLISLTGTILFADPPSIQPTITTWRARKPPPSFNTSAGQSL